MATSVRLIRRYVWLIDTVRRAGHITLDEINRRWLDERSLRLEDEGPIPERTFHRHRQAIADLFGIDILCNRYDGNTYYIDNADELDRPSFTSWLFNGLAMDNRLLADRDTASRIIFQDAPGGTEYLSVIIEAMIHHRRLRTRYRGFDAAVDTVSDLEPYGLRQSGRRWYLIARTSAADSDLTVYALDRIVAADILSDTFDFDPAVDIHSLFNEVIGINLDPDYDCERITVRIFGRQRAYVDSLPLHSSQRVIARTHDYSDYEFTVRPEYELQHALLALGPDAEILSPPWLREEIKWLAEETVKRYR